MFSSLLGVCKGKHQSLPVASEGGVSVVVYSLLLFPPLCGGTVFSPCFLQSGLW